jgi:hypothetical protein
MFREVLRSIVELWQSQTGRRLLGGVATIVGAGTVFYHFVEGWSWLDSFYFTMVTVTTVGYGDFHPTTPLSKIFTIVLLVVGVSSILGFLNYLVKRAVDRRGGARSGDVLLVDGHHAAVVDGDPPGIEPHGED